ncbi:hypothetical protein RHECNPAF_64200124 [Rhizobium etli CNPAF512]|nr:hypothetical protein RHECNPAF_64200124 [Rhizobium etli CNPAF512]
MVDLHPGIPFEGGGSDVIILAHTADRRIGIEPRQDGIADHDEASSLDYFCGTYVRRRQENLSSIISVLGRSLGHTNEGACGDMLPQTPTAHTTPALPTSPTN